MCSAAILLKRESDPFVAGINLSQKTSIVGRDPNCEIVIGDYSVSRRHAELSVNDSLLTVRDLGSKNGTFVDDERIEVGSVQPNQRIRFGSVSFVVATSDGGASVLGSDLETRSLDEAIRAAGGDPDSFGLSVAERRVFDLLLRGMSEKEIARPLGISRHTVHNHIRHIYSAFGVHSRAELMSLVLNDQPPLDPPGANA